MSPCVCSQVICVDYSQLGVRCDIREVCVDCGRLGVRCDIREVCADCGQLGVRCDNWLDEDGWAPISTW